MELYDFSVFNTAAYLWYHGKQFKERESFKRHGITSIERTRSANRHSVTAISGHVADNCPTIRPEKPLSAPGSKSMFVPAFMVSNVQSLSPKIDKVRVRLAMQIWTSPASPKPG